MEQQIFAAFDDEGVFVYQAFNHRIADEALLKGTFGEHFKRTRMTWIKPSLGWMLYRSQYASLGNQERILKIKVQRAGFNRLLSLAIPSSFNPTVFESIATWRQALQASDVRYQWDPDRDIYLRRLSRRALQLGLRRQTVITYIHDWIIALEDVTSLAHEIREALSNPKRALPVVPVEKVYCPGTPFFGAPAIYQR